MFTYDIPDFLDGTHKNTQPKDPPGGLSLGLSYGTAEVLMDTVAVACMTSAGTGTVVENLGRAGDGTLLAGSWGTWENRVVLADPKIKFVHHSSMNLDEPSVGAAIFGKNLSGTLFEKAGDPGHYLKISISGNVVTVLRTFQKTQWVSTGKKGGETQISQWDVTLSNSPGVFDPSDWNVIAVQIANNFWKLIVNGDEIAKLDTSPQFDVDTGKVVQAEDVGNDLYVGPMTGLVDHIVYMGTSSTSLINAFRPTSGKWTSPVIDLTQRGAFHKIELTGYRDSLQSMTATVRLGDDADMYRFSSVALSAPELTPGSPMTVYPGEGWLGGRYCQLVVSMSTEHEVRPYLDDCLLYFRELG